ncbi:autotransporter outer membrane beta-barrel domain-containing protein [Yersinia pseudotuberculosis]|uniref:Outer membrane autotransporter barrel domain protein n=1 Tax=Yersinia pseudotuberculosis serotype O:3 (strain YPIII) TaxID=502800 RepID=A0A0H3AZS0_YERPY|nr:autotransporter YapG [Yersinia pseudotuberculosis]AJJ58238.1 outer membrane autotransporter barrel domain protein [Yersinia pseudotuberculosis YPIII]AYW86664.1 autotransporter outer membrane beta-barrel domain-containing protein [Yersinia pseudotuberculosis]AYX01301.1 autotransporter outer membrane beta-barrel domain-containing protein [Yersinia pseudotuberculosis]AZA29057.1 autotransporter outer membrane beta-barrel domain-containing protein [Yersinia pseudotuberculosis]MBK1426281.1 autotr
MKNSNRSPKNISRNFKHHKETSLSSKNKSPIATCVAAALFIFGSSSVIANPDHEGIVVGKSILNKKQSAVNAIINEGNSLVLTDSASAEHTAVNTGSIFTLKEDSTADITSVTGGFFSLSGSSKANINTVLSGGWLEVNDDASITETTISSDIEKKSTVRLYQDGSATKTTVGDNGILYVSGDSRAEETHVTKGGKLIVYSESQGPTLKNTQIAGTLTLKSDVTLEGKTEFVSSATIKTTGHLIDNQGQLIFNSDKDIVIEAMIDGQGSLTKENPLTTLTLSSAGDAWVASYVYSGETHINAGNLKLANTHFFGSPISGNPNTRLILEKSTLDTTVQGSSVFIDKHSIWNMQGDSNIHHLDILDSGRHDLNNPGKTGNQLIINGDYFSDNGTLIFHSQLAGDDSVTDHILIKGNTGGHTNVRVINVNGEGNKTDSGIQLIEVRGISDGEFSQVGRITAGAYEYRLGRGKDELSKNWYLSSDITDYSSDGVPEAELPGILVLKSDNAAVFSAKLADYALQAVGGVVDSFTQPETSPPSNTPELTVPDPKRANAAVFSAKLADYALQAVGGVVDSFTQPETNTPSNTPELTVPDPKRANAEAFSAKLADYALQAVGGVVDTFTSPEQTEQTEQTTATPDSTPKSTDSAVKPASTPKPTDLAVKPANTVISNAKTAAPKRQTLVHTPENGSYIANIAMARNLFTTRLEDRTSHYLYKDIVTGQWQPTSMWMHTQGGRSQFGHTVEQLNIKGNYYSVQLGGDIAQWATNEQGSGRIGMLAGLGKATNHSHSKVTSYHSRGSVDGYNLGIYATWFADQQHNTGVYIDTLAQYSWFNNAVNGQDKAEEKYKSSGFTTSIESGYTFNLANSDQLSYFIQPNAQITWAGINTQTHKTADGAVVSYRNNGHFITRIGAKAYLQTHDTLNTKFTPFVAVNWIHQNQNTGTTISGQGIDNKIQNSTEFNVGVESQIDQQLHIWANINHQIGRYNYTDTNALVGVKYHF